MKVISIHAPRTGSDVRPHQFLCVEAISIHAPRTGSDAAAGQHGSAGRYFNPRSPHGERLFLAQWRTRTGRFQSTLPARGATRISESTDENSSISIHAPRTGSDI